MGTMPLWSLWPLLWHCGRQGQGQGPWMRRVAPLSMPGPHMSLPWRKAQALQQEAELEGNGWSQLGP